MRPKFPVPFARHWLGSVGVAAMAALSVSVTAAQEKAAPAAGEKPVSKAEADAYAQILAVKPPKGDSELLRLAPEFQRRYPQSAHFEKVAGLAGEAMMRKKDWKGALGSYQLLAERFPKSADIDRFKFQMAICRLELKEYEPAAVLLEAFLKDYPKSGLKEEATYRLAIAYFSQNKYQETVRSCRAYLSAYPEGAYAGLVLYRLAFIDSHDKEVDQSKNIIKFLEEFVAKKPEDPAVGAMRCLLGDTWLKQKPVAVDPAEAAKESRANEDKALEQYRDAAVSLSSVDDTAEYAYKAAEGLLTKRGEKDALRELRTEYRKRLEARLRKMKEEEGQ